MKKYSFPLLALIPTLALGATAEKKLDPMEHSKAIAGFTKWDDVISELKVSLPPLVVKEFAGVVKDQPFPSIKLQKHTLIITRIKDSKKSYLTLGEDGTATLNGKKLNLEPLATPQEEIQRLGELADAKAQAKLMDLLIAQAIAADGDIGATAVVYSGANTWKAKNCGERNLSPELERNCPQMGTALAPIDDYDSAMPDKMRLWPISLKCPKENSGTFALITKNKNQGLVRNSATWIKGKIRNLKIEVGDDSGWSTVLDKDPGSETDSAKKAAQLKVVSRLANLNTKICDAPPTVKARYLKILATNQSELKDRKKTSSLKSETTLE